MMDYSRNIFNQEKLKKGRIAIVGCGPIANYLSAYLCGIGVGNITLIDNENTGNEPDEFMRLLSGGNGSRRNTAIKGIMGLMNDNVKVEDRIDMISNADVVVDLTNNADSKARYRKAADDLNLKGGSNIKLMISASGSFDSASIAMYRPRKKQNPIAEILDRKSGFSKGLAMKRYFGETSIDPFLMERFKDMRQGNFTSGLVAALCADEIRKALSPLSSDYPNDYPLQNSLNFDLSLEERFTVSTNGHPRANSSVDPGLLRQKKALVVGAGGTGTYTALNLALLGFGRIDIYDGDTVEDHNRNRQVFFYGKVGQPKAPALAERLSIISPSISINSYHKYIDEATVKQEIRAADYDIIFSCVDRWLPRRLLNREAVERKIPMFDCAVSLFEGYSYHFIPGKNRCYECRMNFDQLTSMEGSHRTTHCSPSVIVPNAVVGAANAAEAIALLFPEKYRTNSEKYVKFDDISTDSGRMSLKPITYRQECSLGCHDKGV